MTNIKSEFSGYHVWEEKTVNDEHDITCIKGNTVAIQGVRDFDPLQTLECGQCFRWKRNPDGSYTGVVAGRVVRVRYFMDSCILIIENTTIEDFRSIWYNYFDLGTDYAVIKERLASKDDIMKKAIAFGGGIRLLRQELWETAISFIISANNRIPMIMKVVAELSKMYGDEIEYAGEKYFSFPSAGGLSDKTAEELAACRGGFRCRYISLASSKEVADIFNPLKLSTASSSDAREMLKKADGIGDKVADCILLYSGLKMDVFPTDVWVKRVMEELYFGRNASFKEIRQFAAEHFVELAGIAQQYLFYYARENKIGAKKSWTCSKSYDI